MPPLLSEIALGNALLRSIQEGTYPDAEQIISAELPATALLSVVKFLEQARGDVKLEIRSLSRDSAEDIDGWISQAKQLRDDIFASQRLSKDVISQARHGKDLQAQVQDTRAKVHLLDTEIAFNGSLVEILQQLQLLNHELNSIKQSTIQTCKDDVLNLLEEAERSLSAMRACQRTSAVDILRNKINDLREAMARSLRSCWDILVNLEPETSSLTIKQDVQRLSRISLHEVVKALARLDTLNSTIATFWQALDKIVVGPRLKPQATERPVEVFVSSDVLTICEQTSDHSLRALLYDIQQIIEYLRSRMPSIAVESLAQLMMPKVTLTLINSWLLRLLPLDLEEIPSFQANITLVREFVRQLDILGWPGGRELLEWINKLPATWLHKRRESSLEHVRRLLAAGLGSSKKVERTETQRVSEGNNVSIEDIANDDWNPEWFIGGNKSLDRSKTLGRSSTQDPREANVEEEDVSAWGLDDDESSPSICRTSEAVAIASDSEDGEAWGWADDAEKGSPESPVAPVKPRQTNGRQELDPEERHVTLTETYTITSLPDQLIEIIVRAISDSETLDRPGIDYASITLASGDLLTFPALLLSIYRATAPVYYSLHNSGNMFLYNDSLWMAERLRSFAKDHFDRRLNLESDILALEVFGKRSYGKDMEIQRTIIGDLLDGAQGFTNCGEYPFRQQCDTAILSTVDRIRDVHTQWEAVLSHSALLQSTGSLLSTVCNKIIVDVEDLGDISETESKQLASYCNHIASLKDLFRPEQSATPVANEGQPTTLTAVYASNWLKFEYLIEILESSLKDIMYYWTEGELSLEFSAEELIDLIEALFADSELRRRNVGIIRRGSR